MCLYLLRRLEAHFILSFYFEALSSFYKWKKPTSVMLAHKLPFIHPNNPKMDDYGAKLLGHKLQSAKFQISQKKTEIGNFDRFPTTTQNLKQSTGNSLIKNFHHSNNFLPFDWMRNIISSPKKAMKKLLPWVLAAWSL